MQYLGLIVVLKLTVRLVIMQTESEIDFYICYVD